MSKSFLFSLIKSALIRPLRVNNILFIQDFRNNKEDNKYVHVGKALQMIDGGDQAGGIAMLTKLQEEHPDSEMLSNALRMAE